MAMKMRKINYWKFAGAIFIISCLFAGCKRKIDDGMDEQEKFVREVELSVGAAGDEAVPVVSDSSDSTQLSGSQNKNFPQISELNRDLFDGSNMQLWNAGDERLIVLKEDTLYLYDVIKGSILAQEKTEQWFLLNVYPCNDGFCIIGSIDNHISDENGGNNGNDGNSKNDGSGEKEPFFTVIEEEDDFAICLAVFLDESLQERDRLVLNDIVEYPDASVWTPFPDMSGLAYFNIWDGLCIYECDAKTTRRLLDFSDSGTDVFAAKASNLLAIDVLFFDEGGEGLVFTGDTAQGNFTAKSWGRINLDGTGFENHIFEKSAGVAAAYKNGKLLLGEDSLTFEKRMAYVDVATGEERYGGNVEGGYTICGPFFSDTGETFAVTDIGGGNQAVLTIYSGTDFSEIYREVIEDKEEYFYSSPKIYLFDGLRVCLVCMGGYEIPMKSFLIRY